MTIDKRKHARKKALRATLLITSVAIGGCPSSHSDDMPDTSVSDGSIEDSTTKDVVRFDSGGGAYSLDATLDRNLCFAVEAYCGLCVELEERCCIAGHNVAVEWSDAEQCCEVSCLAVGPLVPPEM